MLRTISILALLASSIVGLQGCAVFASASDKAAKAGGKLVTFYCDNITVPQIREELRAAVNKYAAPNSVRVECANDGPVLQSAPVETPALH